jgi:hypothetical protein
MTLIFTPMSNDLRSSRRMTCVSCAISFFLFIVVDSGQDQDFRHGFY